MADRGWVEKWGIRANKRSDNSIDLGVTVDLDPGWRSTRRIFLGAGAWDEYGRRLDGPRNTDLETYRTRVAGDLVEIGSAVATPAGSPIGSTTFPTTDDIPIRSDDTISLTDAEGGANGPRARAPSFSRD